ncbi:hypothetical protein HOD29_04970 [archaeon]|jgi:hypothetical protein|nr:hypothetical protein [archaeon]
MKKLTSLEVLRLIDVNKTKTYVHQTHFKIEDEEILDASLEEITLPAVALVEESEGSNLLVLAPSKEAYTKNVLSYLDGECASWEGLENFEECKEVTLKIADPYSINAIPIGILVCEACRDNSHLVFLIGEECLLLAPIDLLEDVLEIEIYEN